MTRSAAVKGCAVLFRPRLARATLFLIIVKIYRMMLDWRRRGTKLATFYSPLSSDRGEVSVCLYMSVYGGGVARSV